MGEEELAGVDIFSIAQDDDNIIWLSSDNGIYKYNGYEFLNIKSSSKKSNSLFGLTKDNFGAIYCCNLSGQIFKVNNDSLQLFYQIPDSLLSNLVHFNFDNKNRLVFCTQNYYLVNENNQTKYLFPSEYSSNRIAKNKEGELIFVDFLSKQIASYKDDKITSKELLDFGVNFPYITDGEFYLITLGKPNVCYQYNEKWKKINLVSQDKLLGEHTNIFPINDILIAFAFKNKGVRFYNKNGSLKYNHSKLFPKHKVSEVLTDNEGNIWLTTLGKGIIIIPNVNIIDYNNHPLLKDDDIKTITSDNEGNILTAGLNGNVYKIKDGNIEIFANQDSEIEFIKFDKKNNSIFYDNQLLSLNYKSKISLSLSSLKDISFAKLNQYYIATNMGLFSAIVNEGKSTKLKQLSKHRTSCVSYDNVRKEIWAGTTKGLQLISDTETKFILIDNQPISAIDITCIENEIWVSTTNKGILIFKNGSFSRYFKPTINKSVYKVKYKNHKLYYSSNEGFNIYNFNDKTLSNLSKTDGLVSNKIADFEIVDNNVWLVLANGLQCINLNQIAKNNTPPVIKWNKILVNDKVQNVFTNEFKYNQNQFEFHFTAVSFRHRGTLTYQYQLEGINSDWQEISFTNNYVKFQSLPQGKYIFRVKAINENGIESETLSYSFTITPPFWNTWWFFTICGLFLVLIVASYFIIRLRIIRKRLTLQKQLKTSEITAIKAQMNPHFMFNALNSIQDLIMLKDIRNSNVYLGKFADLMRKTLEFSGKNFIALSDEIEILHLYLELEKLRFGDDFSAIINCNIESKKLQDLQIPSMLLQTYVENAIKHGLLHKKDQKELTINFYLKSETLICEIIDNGVGRKKSAEIKNRREKTYPSFSTEANKKRIDLIIESTSLNIDLTIIDLEENGIATGTKVIFEFN